MTMTAAQAVGGSFTIQRYILTVTAPSHGTITATGITCGTGGDRLHGNVRLGLRRPPRRHP